MRWEIAAVTDVGLVRSENQDAVLATEAVAVVADGMGGHRGGEVASSIAVECFRSASRPGTVEELVEVVRAANGLVLGRSLTEPELAGMGTTVCSVVALADPPRLGLVNVGDSRAYLLDESGMRQLSEDHSFVETLVREGRLTRAQADVHPQRNVLTRALGIEADLAVDAWDIECGDGDRFLLCSDGLFNEVADPDIEATLRSAGSAAEAAAELVEMARGAGGHDNISVVVIDIADSGHRAPAGRVVRRVGQPAPPVVVDADLPEATAPGVPTGDAETPKLRAGFTWRVGLVVAAVLAVFGVAAGSVLWFGRSTHWLGVRDGAVVRFQGNPGGVLWVEPVTIPSDLRLDQVATAADRVKLCAGWELESAGKAKTQLERLLDERVESQIGMTCATAASPTVSMASPTTTSTSTSTSIASTSASTTMPTPTPAPAPADVTVAPSAGQ